MSELFDDDLSELHFELSSQTSSALPLDVGKALHDTLDIILYQTLYTRHYILEYTRKYILDTIAPHV